MFPMTAGNVAIMSIAFIAIIAVFVVCIRRELR